MEIFEQDEFINNISHCMNITSNRDMLKLPPYEKNKFIFCGGVTLKLMLMGKKHPLIEFFFLECDENEIKDSILSTHRPVKYQVTEKYVDCYQNVNLKKCKDFYVNVKSKQRNKLYAPTIRFNKTKYSNYGQYLDELPVENRIMMLNSNGKHTCLSSKECINEIKEKIMNTKINHIYSISNPLIVVDVTLSDNEKLKVIRGDILSSYSSIDPSEYVSAFSYATISNNIKISTNGDEMIAVIQAYSEHVNHVINSNLSSFSPFLENET